MKIDYREKRILGKSGVAVTRLVFGTSGFGGFLRFLVSGDALRLRRRA